MPTAECLNKIKQEEPPSNIPCTDAFCVMVSDPNNRHCKKQGLPMDTPVIGYDTNLYGPGKGGACYCCCSCFAANTPIEVEPGEYALIQDLNDGDLILAAGADLQWRPTRIDKRSGDLEPVDFPRAYMVYYAFPDDPAPRAIFVTPDHLFMSPDRQARSRFNIWRPRKNS